ncbi:MAG: DUF1588 domain-containing protein, partial [Myxococcota bacterium]
ISERFPGFNEDIRADMVSEAEAFFAYVLFNDRPLTELFSADYAVVNHRLARFYGLSDVPGSSEGFTRVDGDGQRGGLLRLGAFLARNAGFEDSSLIRRAVSIRKNMLCHTILAPDDVVINSGREEAARDAFEGLTSEQIAALTTREYIERLTSPAACAQCHLTMINPLGAGMEAFDAVGQRRSTDNSQAIDTTGALIGISGVHRTDEQIAFAGADELGSILADQRRTSFCIAQKALTSFTSTELQADRTCMLQPITTNLHDGAPMRALFESLGALDAVRFRR